MHVLWRIIGFLLLFQSALGLQILKNTYIEIRPQILQAGKQNWSQMLLIAKKHNKVRPRTLQTANRKSKTKVAPHMLQAAHPKSKPEKVMPQMLQVAKKSEIKTRAPHVVDKNPKMKGGGFKCCRSPAKNPQ